MKNKITALLLSLVLCVGLMGTAFAVDTVTAKDVKAGDRIFIRDTDGATVTDIVVGKDGKIDAADVKAYADTKGNVGAYKLVNGKQTPVTITVTTSGTDTPENPSKPGNTGSSGGTSGGGSGGGNGGSGASGGSSSNKPGTTTPGTTTPSTPSGGGTVSGFGDVSTTSWYAQYVQYVTEQGLFSGMSAGSFAPNVNMNRAMMWTVLARYKGVDTNGGANWYEKARTWAISQGISDGTMPTSNVTREQFVTMLWRLAGQPTANGNATFSDNGKVSSWAKTAVDWAVAQGIINGYSDSTFRPQGNATRAEVAKMLTVYCRDVAL